MPPHKRADIAADVTVELSKVQAGARHGPLHLVRILVRKYANRRDEGRQLSNYVQGGFGINLPRALGEDESECIRPGIGGRHRFFQIGNPADLDPDHGSLPLNLAQSCAPASPSSRNWQGFWPRPSARRERLTASARNPFPRRTYHRAATWQLLSQTHTAPGSRYP